MKGMGKATTNDALYEELQVATKRGTVKAASQDSNISSPDTALSRVLVY